VTIARNAPLNEAGWRHKIMVSEKKKVKYFRKGGATAAIALKMQTKIIFARMWILGVAGSLSARPAAA
jgi:hypothetical protein